MVKRIHSIKRLDSSVNGNPRFAIAFDDAAASPLTTSSDCGFCYAVGNPDMREGCLVRVTLTRADRIADMSPVGGPNAEDCAQAAALLRNFDRWLEDNRQYEDDEDRDRIDAERAKLAESLAILEAGA
jgi:hypothetical protein